MKIHQLMYCMTPGCKEVSPVATCCPICGGQDLAELGSHAETIEENEREQRRDDLAEEINSMRDKMHGYLHEDEPLGVCV